MKNLQRLDEVRCQLLLDNLNFYGDTANKIRELRDKTGLFNRFIDVYMAAGVIGVLFNKKGEETIQENKVTIFAETLMGEAIRIKYLSSLAFLVDNFEKKFNEQELLKLAFADWFSSEKDQDITKEKNKYFIFKQYVIGGVDILYDEIIGDSNDPEIYLRNYYHFINKVNKLELSNTLSRTIEGALL
jgi:hypothetical protein